MIHNSETLNHMYKYKPVKYAEDFNKYFCTLEIFFNAHNVGCLTYMYTAHIF